MAGHNKNKRNQRSRSAKASRRRALGAGTTAGAFLAFGMAPLATAPAAHADVFDVIIDPIVNSILAFHYESGCARRHRSVLGSGSGQPGLARH